MKRFLSPIAAALLLLSACAGSAPVSAAGQKTAAAMPSYRTIPANQLKSMLESKDFLLVNVHTPYAGEIKGTDVFVPYDRIQQELGKFPSDKNAKIIVYCQSGYMSAIAARTLAGLGYTNVFDLEGGMLAWQNAGYPLVQSQN